MASSVPLILEVEDQPLMSTQIRSDPPGSGPFLRSSTVQGNMVEGQDNQYEGDRESQDEGHVIMNSLLWQGEGGFVPGVEPPFLPWINNDTAGIPGIPVIPQFQPPIGSPDYFQAAPPLPGQFPRNNSAPGIPMHLSYGYPGPTVVPQPQVYPAPAPIIVQQPQMYPQLTVAQPPQIIYHRPPVFRSHDPGPAVIGPHEYEPGPVMVFNDDGSPEPPIIPPQLPPRIFDGYPGPPFIQPQPYPVPSPGITFQPDHDFVHPMPTGMLDGPQIVPVSFRGPAMAPMDDWSDNSIHGVPWSPSHQEIHDLADVNKTKNKTQSKRTRKLEAEQPSAVVDDHTHFWPTYDRVAGAYDKELLDAWNKSLDVLLIFAGLFSAINTAFIIESYRGLQPEPADVTNALLRLLITHRHDNVTLSLQDLDPGSAIPSAVPVNSIFFSSLSFSLAAAFGAVTAKQWLTEYANVGAMKALPIQSRMRQEKYKGLKTWHLRLIIEVLPMLLQISLFLFLLGVVQFLWMLDRKVATVQLVLSCAGVAVYLISVVIGIIVPTSPFQTSLSKNLPHYLSKIGRNITEMPLRGFAALAVNIFGRLGIIERLIDRINTSDSWQSLQSFIKKRILLVHERPRSTDSHDRAISEPSNEDMQWNPTDISTAESVIWLLEQAEHPDMTITALDAVPRLPPDLLLSLVQQREGLLERLIRFHNSQLPLASSGGRDFDWVKAWPDRAIVSGIALWHILRAKRPTQGDNDRAFDSLLQSIDTSSDQLYSIWDEWPKPSNDPHVVDELLRIVTKFTLNCAFNFLSKPREAHTWRLDKVWRSISSLSKHSYLLHIKLMDAHQGSTSNSFTTSISPLRLALDTVIYRACTQSSPQPTFGADKFDWGMICRNLLSVLQGELSYGDVSHVALAFTAIYLRQLGMIFIPDANQESFQRMIVIKSYAADKRVSILENVALALSSISPANEIIWVDNDGRDIFRALIRITGDLFYDTFTNLGAPIPYPEFPQCLLRFLKRRGLDHGKIQFLVSRLLAICPDGDWVSPLHEEFGRTVIKLLASVLIESAQPWNPLQPTSTSLLLDKIARALDDTEFLRVIEHPTGLDGCLKGIAKSISGPYYQFAPEFVTRTLKLQPPASSAVSLLLDTQISFVAAILSNWQWEWNPVHESVVAFFNRMLIDDTQFSWPAYLISTGLISLDTHRGETNETDGLVWLRFIEPRRLKDSLHQAQRWQGRASGMLQPWLGEALLLLWRIAKYEHSNGRLPSEWKDSMFFTRDARALMEGYRKLVQRESYTGVDYRLLGEYLDAYPLTQDDEEVSQEEPQGITTAQITYEDFNTPPSTQGEQESQGEDQEIIFVPAPDGYHSRSDSPPPQLS